MGNEQNNNSSDVTITKLDIDAQLRWADLAGFSELKYFWKDMNRRFVGVSQSFLDYYGFDSADVLIGKTDEEMGWHVANRTFKYDEEDVLETGKRVVNVSGKCLIKGVLHEIYTNKKPIYRDGKIIGLFGFFVDAESIESGNKKANQITIDQVTGLCNVRGFFESFSYFEEEYDSAHRNVFAIGVQTDGYEEYVRTFGERAGDQYLKAVTEVLLNHFQTKAVLSRLQTNKFMMLTKYNDSAALQAELNLLKEDLCKLSQIGEHPCSCKPYVFTFNATTTSELEKATSSFLVNNRRGNMLVLKQMVESFGADWDNLLYLNLNTLDASVFKHNGIFEEAPISDYEGFKKAYDGYVKANVSSVDRTCMEALGTLDVIREKLASTTCYDQQYTDAEGHACAFRIVKLGAPEQAPYHIVLAINN